MSGRPLHEQVSDFVRIWMRDKRDGEMGVNAPISHTGPMKGPLDWYIGMGMIFGFLGLMQGHGETWAGLIGVAVGVVIVALWNLFWWVVKLLLIAIFRPNGDRPENKTVHTASTDENIERYYRRKKQKKK